MTTTKDKLKFALLMGRHTKASLRQVQALMRYASTLQHLAEDQCNRVWTERDESQRRRIQASTVKVCSEILGDISKGQVIANGYYCAPIFSGDPRGAVLKIRVPSGYSNSMGGEGICVPS